MPGSELRAAPLPVRPWQRSANLVLEELQVQREVGLDPAQARARLELHGPNQLRQRGPRSGWMILLDQLRSAAVLLLVGAAILSAIFGAAQEGVAIMLVIVLNTLIGFTTELRAVRSMSALRQLGSARTRVRRSGELLLVDARELVPGDILVLEAGDIVTADARLLLAEGLMCDESSFSGESVPVEKHSAVLESGQRVDERANSLFRGTSLTRGRCEAVVVATGMQTELGHITRLTETGGSETTPLEQKLERLTAQLVLVTLVIAALTTGLGIAAGKPVLLMVETGIALAVATIPEGLPIVATIALARGLWRMSRRNVLINRLSAVETLGSTDLICSDKTGTLTENRLRVERLWTAAGEYDFAPEGGALAELGPLERATLEVATLCNDAALAPDGHPTAGDPLEVALLNAALAAGISPVELRERNPRTGERPFDSESKRMATIHSAAGRTHAAIKGAPEAVLDICSSQVGERGPEALDEARRERWAERADELARAGLRVIAAASKQLQGERDEPLHEACLLGLLALADPPREDAREAIRACRRAGVRVVMLTGDHPATAASIAAAVGLTEVAPGETPPPAVQGQLLESADSLDESERTRLRQASVFARVSPAQKLDLIRLHRQAGSVVAMIGDGVNDAPALRMADIGIAMGERGTQVAREAAEMVLTDDSFSSIVAAIEEGRGTFRNIRKFVVYLLSCNVSEVMIVALATLSGAPLPVTPLQILFLNLVSDIFPALALGMGRASADSMQRPPRAAREGILTRRHVWAIAGHGTTITLSTLSVFWLAMGPLDLDPERAVTLAFLTLAFAQLAHVLNMRSDRSPFWRNEVTRNPHVWGALALCTLLLLAAVHIPALARPLALIPPSAGQWALVLGFALLPLALGPLIFKSLRSAPRPPADATSDRSSGPASDS